MKAVVVSICLVITIYPFIVLGIKSESKNFTLEVSTLSNGCINLQPLLIKQGDACRCYDLEDVSDKDNDHLIVDNQFTATGRPVVWVGCTRERMPMIYRSLNSMPNDTKLSKLWIWDSLIPLVPLRFFVKIRAEKLILENNHLGELAPGVLSFMASELRILVLRNNIIKEINYRMFAELNELRKLDLSGNILSELDKNSLGTLKNLQTLTFYNNKLSRLGDDTFAGLKNLKHLNLASNDLTSINANTFSGLNNLEILSLENNKISQIAEEAFEHLVSLKILNLGGNLLTTVSLPNSLFQLKQLYLNNNTLHSVKDLRVSSIPSLEMIHLDKNKIVAIEPDVFKRFPNLQVISMASNKIASLQLGALNGVENLTVLSLQNNQIDKIPSRFFVETPRLKQLLLSQNFLTDLKDDVFAGLTQLTVLSLAHNQIKLIERKAFIELSSLERLYLNDNFLQLLEENATLLNIKSLYALDISDNLWQCECPLLWLSKWIIDHGEIVINSENTFCEKSSQPLGDVFKDLQESCRHGFPTKNQNFVDSEKVANVTWVTAVGFILGIVSLLILFTVVALYLQEEKGRWTFVKFQQQQKHLLKRVPSDMVNLIPKELHIKDKE